MTVAHVDAGGRSWAYLEAGSGPLVMLFHGTLSNKEVYAALLGQLSQRHHVVAFDWPGHGGSDFDPDGWTVEQLVDAIPELMDALGERSAVIGGVSQGGAVTMRAALKYPDRVDALITMSAGPDRPGSAAVAAVTALGEVLADGTDDERREALARMQAQYYHAPGWIEAHPEAGRIELERMLSHPRAAMRAATRIPATYDSIEDDLGDIACPTLVIWGDQDVRAFWGPTMAEKIPDARLVTLAGAGHHVTLDAPQATTEAIAAFLDALR